MNNNSISSADTYWRYLPLLTPAIKKKSCDRDFDLMTSRIAIVGLTAISTSFLPVLAYHCGFSWPTCVLLNVVGPLSILTVIPIDDWLTERAADVKAVNEYLNKPYPSKSAAFRIRHNFSAAKLLVSKKGDLNKVNEQGMRLLDNFSELNVFQLLIDNGADVKSLDQFGVSYFQRAVEHKDPAYLEAILKSNKVIANNFNSTQQMELWNKLGSVKAGYLLKNYGFDVNIKDNTGYTPLLRIVKEASGVFSWYGNLGIAAHVSTLLDCGADRSITVDVNGTPKNAMQICKNPVICEILQKN